jgi:hypothetical protein
VAVAVSGLYVPELPAGAGTLDAALRYAEAGWCQVPLRLGTKHPGSVLGAGWPEQSSRDKKTLTAWFSGTSYGIALHVGRCGAVVFDVDNPDALPETLAAALADAAVPYQATRPDMPGRGHYVFAMPPGRVLGNGAGKLGTRWGEVRGRNGVIVVAPSEHSNGGRYAWQRVGPVPVLPAGIAEALSDASEQLDPADDATVAAFIDKHTTGNAPGRLAGPLNRLSDEIAAGASVHDATRNALCWALREAAAGLYPAAEAVAEIKRRHRAGYPSKHSGRGEPPPGEWADLVAYATAHAQAADPAATLAQSNRDRQVSVLDVAPARDLVLEEALPASRPNRLAARTYTRAQLAQLPPPEELIVGTLDLRTVALLYGARGSLKSFTMLGWLASIATGVPWLGRPVKRTGRVLYVCGEGAYGIHPRLAAWEQKHLREIPDDRLAVVNGRVNLLNDGEVTDLVELAQGCLAVGIDTLSRCMPGADENSARDMSTAVENLGKLREATGDGIVVVAHHTPRAGDNPRGSTVLEGAMDAMYLAEGDHRQVTLKRTKRKDGPQDDQLTVAFEPIGPLSGVLADKRADMSSRADDLVRVMSANFAATGCTKAELRLASDMAPSTFYRSLQSLISLGIVTNEGTDRRPFYRLANRS